MLRFSTPTKGAFWKKLKMILIKEFELQRWQPKRKSIRGKTLYR